VTVTPAITLELVVKDWEVVESSCFVNTVPRSKLPESAGSGGLGGEGGGTGDYMTSYRIVYSYKTVNIRQYTRTIKSKRASNKLITVNMS